MTEAEMSRIASEIDAVTDELSRVRMLRVASDQACAMALALAAARHVIHGDGSQADFDVLMHAAWAKARAGHS